jgi:hypothetical protein
MGALRYRAALLKLWFFETTKKPRGPVRDTTSTRHTYCVWHLGDNLAHLHFLRKLAIQRPDLTFSHGCNGAYIPQLAEVIEDLPNIKLTTLKEQPRNSVNAWKNADGFFIHHPQQSNYSAFFLDWFRVLAGKLGFETPFHVPADLLFDYPRLKIDKTNGLTCDFLVVNSTPKSAQLADFKPNYFEPLIAALFKKGHRIIVTQPTAVGPGIYCTSAHGLSVSDIGNISLRSTNIVGMVTGSIWPTFNVWNPATVKRRIVFLDHEILNLCGETQVQTMEQAMKVLAADGSI